MTKELYTDRDHDFFPSYFVGTKFSDIVEEDLMIYQQLLCSKHIVQQLLHCKLDDKYNYTCILLLYDFNLHLGISYLTLLRVTFLCIYIHICVYIYIYLIFIFT